MTPSGTRLVASATRIALLPKDSLLAAASSHVEERLRSAGFDSRSISTLRLEPLTRNAFIAAAEFERRQYEKYRPVIAARLNRIHGVQRTAGFWGDQIGLTLLMHVSNCRRIWALAQEAVKRNHDIELLARECFRTPSTESDYRWQFQYGDLGDEQLLATCMEIVAPGAGYPRFVTTPAETPRAGSAKSALTRQLRRARRVAGEIRDDPLLAAREPAAIALRRLVRPALIVTHCFWSRAAKQRIVLRSRGRIAYEDLNLCYERRPADPASAARRDIAESPDTADPFGRFFFSSLRWAAPTSWLEDFPARYKSARAVLAARPSVRVIANESLDEDTSLILAAAKESGIRTIYCEHNYLQHQFVGNIVWLLQRKAEVYLTLGWFRPGSGNLVPTGSYYAWTAPGKRRKSIDVLFIAGVAMVRSPLASAGYGEAAEHAPSYRAMMLAYLGSLSPDTLGRMYYKDYPTARRAALGLHALEDRLLDPYIARLGTHDRTGEERTASLIRRSRLVVVNYLSTPYNEALLSGVPTIILFNAATYHLTDAEREFYNDLKDAGIFQIDPIAAAGLTEAILDDPLKWWHTDKVKRAREKYLEQNFGDPDALGRYLLNAASRSGGNLPVPSAPK